MPFRTLDQLEVRGKRVLLRADLNVPVKDGRITDLTRLRAAVPDHPRTLRQGGAGRYLQSLRSAERQACARDVIAAGGERTRGSVGSENVRFAETCVGPWPNRRSRHSRTVRCWCLENTRFDPREEKNDPRWQRSWPHSLMSMSTTLSPLRIAHTPAQRAWRVSADLRRAADAG